MTNSREQAAREPSLDYKSKMDNSEPFVLKRRTEGERLAYLQGYNAGCEHEAKRLLKYYKEWYELIKDGHTEAEGLYCVIADLEVSLKEANPPKEESE